MPLLITYGSAGESLARSIASINSWTLVGTTRRRFPDGEQYVRVMGSVANEEVAVVQPFGGDPDRLLMEYTLLVDALKGAGCGSVTGVLPYLAYARQDNRFQSGEALSAKLFPRLVEEAGTNRLITVDLHLHRFRKIGQVFRIPAMNLSAFPSLADYYFRTYGSENTLVVGPDMESEQWAQVVAGVLSTDHIILKKQRLGDREVQVSGALPVRGRKVVLVDDMVSTGRTLMEVTARLRSEGAARITALVTHALLVEGAYRKLKEVGLTELIATDTVPNVAAKVSVAPLIAKALGEW